MCVPIAVVREFELAQTSLYALQKTVHLLVYHISVSPKQQMHNGLLQRKLQFLAPKKLRKEPKRLE